MPLCSETYSSLGGSCMGILPKLPAQPAGRAITSYTVCIIAQMKLHCACICLLPVPAASCGCYSCCQQWREHPALWAWAQHSLPVMQRLHNRLQCPLLCHLLRGRQTAACPASACWSPCAVNLPPCREHLRIDPQSSSAAFWLAALTHDSSAAACPSSLVARMFDQYADHFDQHLVEQLQYKTPLVLMKCIQEAAAIASQGAQWSCCIDLGCGTGLMGPLLRQHVQHLAGIDLSSKMVEKARERGCYDELAVGELAQYLETAAQQGADQAYDLLVAADVFVYIGDLLPVLMAAAATATDRALFAFSTELLQGSSAAGSEQISSVCSPANCSIAAPADSSTQGSSQGPTGDQASTDAMGHYALQATGRYAHSPGYLRSMAAATGWQTLLLKLAVIRFNAGKPIYGNLCVLHRC
eukprot:GHRR01022148.1.p1 GENE.GHRR01022148.1~~GHRR01022148.1.p1  ORF type:complete len:412 (+),score=104.67 GHRR01022148.1:619-1854(+)